MFWTVRCFVAYYCVIREAVLIGFLVPKPPEPEIFLTGFCVLTHLFLSVIIWHNPRELGDHFMDLTYFEQLTFMDSWPYFQCELMHCHAGISLFWTAQILTLRYHFTQMSYVPWNVILLRCGFMKYEFVFPVIWHSVSYRKDLDTVVGVVTPYGLEVSGFEIF
jgi:hypothetical protein